MADTEHTEVLDPETEVNPATDRSQHDGGYVDEAWLRKVVCSAIRWPFVVVGLVLLAVLVWGDLRDRQISGQVSSLRTDLATQRDGVATTQQKVDDISATREQEAAKVAERLNDLSHRVEYVAGKLDEFFNATDKLKGHMTELSERMDRADAQDTREADARRDLIRTMEAFGQRLQRQ